MASRSKPLPTFDSSEVAMAWGVKPPGMPIAFVSEQKRKEKIQENRRGEKWTLVFILPLSPLDLWNLLGERNLLGKRMGKRQRSYFKKSTIWKFDPPAEPAEWLTTKPMEGYYLLNLNQKLRKETFAEQEDFIAKMSNGCRRASAIVVMQALLSIYLITQKWCLKGDLHWGLESDRPPGDPDGQLLFVGRSRRSRKIIVGFAVVGCMKESPFGLPLGVVLEQKPDIKIGYA